MKLRNTTVYIMPSDKNSNHDYEVRIARQYDFIPAWALLSRKHNVGLKGELHILFSFFLEKIFINFGISPIDSLRVVISNLIGHTAQCKFVLTMKLGF